MHKKVLSLSFFPVGPIAGLILGSFLCPAPIGLLMYWHGLLDLELVLSQDTTVPLSSPQLHTSQLSNKGK